MKLTVLVLLLVLMTGIAGPGLSAQDLTSLQNEFWIPVNPMGPQGPLKALDESTAVKALLEEARQVFSGMIYGFSFTYTPSDVKREVTEDFNLLPLGDIGWGNENLEYRESWSDGACRYFRFRYLLSDAEVGRMEALQSATLQNAQATGAATLFLGLDGKLASLKAGIKEAVRAFARPKMQNKPAWLKGRLWLESIPRSWMDHGDYLTMVRVKIDLEDLGEYKVF